jgi:tetratricopeptide (TPR) repeat protein
MQSQNTIGRHSRLGYGLRRNALLLLLAVLVCITGCRSANKLLLEAVALQARGNNAAALQDYIALLSRVPAGDHELISLLETKVGECLLAQGEVRPAYVALNKAVEQDPSNTKAHLRLGEVMLVAGAPGEAMAQARIVLTADPNNLDALAVLAQGMSLSGKPESATFVFKQILEVEPTRTDLSLDLAELQVQSNELDAARDTLNHAAAAKPHDPAPWLALGRLEEIAGQGQAAEQAYRQAVSAQDTPRTELRLAQFLARSSRMEEAEAVLRHLTPAAADSATALPDFDLLAGRAGVAQTEYVEQLRRQNVSQKANSGALDARLLESMLEQASDGEGDGNANQELNAAARWLAKSQNSISPEDELILRGELAMAAGNLDLATTFAERAATRFPNSAPAIYLLGIVNQRRGLRSAAIENWRKAVDLDSKFSPALQVLAENALKQNDLQSAEHNIAEVVLDEPENFRALCLYARILLAQHRFDEAGDLARRALAANPSSAEPHVILGNIAAAQRRFGIALIEFEQGLLRDPHSSEAIDSLEDLYRVGNVSRAMIAKMERIAGNPPVSAPLLEIAGRLYYDQGWYRDAKRALQHALAADPGRRSAAAVLARIYLSDNQPASAAAMLNKLDPASAAIVSASSGPQGSETARDKYEDAVNAGDASGIAANNLAWSYAVHGERLDRALQLAKLAHQLAPQNAQMMDTLGIVHLERHEYSDAISALRHAAELARAPAADKSRAVLDQIEAHLRYAYRLSGQVTPSDN